MVLYIRPAEYVLYIVQMVIYYHCLPFHSFISIPAQ